MGCIDVTTDRQAEPLRVLVCQRGARHRYAVPRLLEEAGLLAALYTDSCSYSFLGRICGGFTRAGFGSRDIRALASRVPAGIPRSKIFSSDRIWLHALAGKEVGLESVYQQWGLNGASAVYSMYGEEVPFLQWAKEQGAKIIVDVIIHPGTSRIVVAEEQRLMGGTELSRIEDEEEHTRRVFGLADVLLCPSEWVAEGVRDFSAGFVDKVKVSPYGSSVTPSLSINEPETGRILFAGRDPLRKGLHHLAEAAYLLRQKGIKLQVRVAGVNAADIGWMEHRDQLHCLGSVPMEQMRQEYALADLFVLPSLSEGQAGVVLEAMASGVPVVATRESGIDFSRDGGINVPVQNPQRLAYAIESVVSDRSRRRQLAEGALRQSAEYSMDEWKKRLVHVVQQVVS